MSGLLAGIILFFTVSTALVLGILAAYGAISGILLLFAQQSRPRIQSAPAVLVPSETHAIGD